MSKILKKITACALLCLCVHSVTYAQDSLTENYLDTYTRDNFELKLNELQFAVNASVTTVIVSSVMLGLGGIGVTINDTLTSAGFYAPMSPTDVAIGAASYTLLSVGVIGVIAAAITYSVYNERYLDTLDQWVRYNNASRR